MWSSGDAAPVAALVETPPSTLKAPTSFVPAHVFGELPLPDLISRLVTERQQIAREVAEIESSILNLNASRGQLTAPAPVARKTTTTASALAGSALDAAPVPAPTSATPTPAAALATAPADRAPATATATATAASAPTGTASVPAAVSPPAGSAPASAAGGAPEGGTSAAGAVPSVRELGKQLDDISSEHPYIAGGEQEHPLRYWLDRAREAVGREEAAAASGLLQKIRDGISIEASRMRCAFDHFDTDGDGSVDASEFGHMCACLGLDNNLKDADLDANGIISFQELQRFVGGRGGLQALLERRRSAVTESRPGADGMFVGARVLAAHPGRTGGAGRRMAGTDMEVVEATLLAVNPEGSHGTVRLAYHGDTTKWRDVPRVYVVSGAKAAAVTAAMEELGFVERAQGFYNEVYPEAETQAVAALQPCQRRALRWVRDQATVSHKRDYPALLERFETLQLDKEKLEQTLAWVQDFAPYVVHVDIDKTGQFLEKDDFYRNQFETKTSGGALDDGNEIRRGWEAELFGSAYDDASGFDRCKYGALNVTNDYKGVQSASQYGDSYLVLRDVRLRCTFAARDSGGLASSRLGVFDKYAHVLKEYSDEELRAVVDVATAGPCGPRPDLLCGETEDCTAAWVTVGFPGIAQARGRYYFEVRLSAGCSSPQVGLLGSCYEKRPGVKASSGVGDDGHGWAVDGLHALVLNGGRGRFWDSQDCWPQVASCDMWGSRSSTVLKEGVIVGVAVDLDVDPPRFHFTSDGQWGGEDMLVRERLQVRLQKVSAEDVIGVEFAGDSPEIARISATGLAARWNESCSDRATTAQPGDRVVAINDALVSSGEQLRRALDEALASSDSLRLELERCRSGHGLLSVYPAVSVQGRVEFIFGSPGDPQSFGLKWKPPSSGYSLWPGAPAASVRTDCPNVGSSGSFRLGYYKEIQLHGELRLDRHVQRLVANPKYRDAPKASRSWCLRLQGGGKVDGTYQLVGARGSRPAYRRDGEAPVEIRWEEPVGGGAGRWLIADAASAVAAAAGRVHFFVAGAGGVEVPRTGWKAPPEDLGSVSRKAFEAALRAGGVDPADVDRLAAALAGAEGRVSRAVGAGASFDEEWRRLADRRPGGADEATAWGWAVREELKQVLREFQVPPEAQVWETSHPYPARSHRTSAVVRLEGRPDGLIVQFASMSSTLDSSTLVKVLPGGLCPERAGAGARVRISVPGIALRQLLGHCDLCGTVSPAAGAGGPRAARLDPGGALAELPGGSHQAKDFTITSDHSGQAGYSFNPADLALVSIDPDGPAYQAGMRQAHAGWIITHVEGQEVTAETGKAALDATREPDRTFTIRASQEPGADGAPPPGRECVVPCVASPRSVRVQYRSASEAAADIAGFAKGPASPLAPLVVELKGGAVGRAHSLGVRDGWLLDLEETLSQFHGAADGGADGTIPGEAPQDLEQALSNIDDTLAWLHGLLRTNSPVFCFLDAFHFDLLPEAHVHCPGQVGHEIGSFLNAEEGLLRPVRFISDGPATAAGVGSNWRLNVAKTLELSGGAGPLGADETRLLERPHLLRQASGVTLAFQLPAAREAASLYGGRGWTELLELDGDRATFAFATDGDSSGEASQRWGAFALVLPSFPAVPLSQEKLDELCKRWIEARALAEGVRGDQLAVEREGWDEARLRALCARHGWEFEWMSEDGERRRRAAAAQTTAGRRRASLGS